MLKRLIPAYTLVAACAAASIAAPTAQKTLSCEPDSKWLSKTQKVTSISIDKNGKISRTGAPDATTDEVLKDGISAVLPAMNFVESNDRCRLGGFSFYMEKEETKKIKRGPGDENKKAMIVFDFNGASPNVNMPVLDGYLLLSTIWDDHHQNGPLTSPLDVTEFGFPSMRSETRSFYIVEPWVRLSRELMDEIKKAGGLATREGPELDQLRHELHGK